MSGAEWGTKIETICGTSSAYRQKKQYVEVIIKFHLNISKWNGIDLEKRNLSKCMKNNISL